MLGTQLQLMAAADEALDIPQAGLALTDLIVGPDQNGTVPEILHKLLRSSCLAVKGSLLVHLPGPRLGLEAVLPPPLHRHGACGPPINTRSCVHKGRSRQDSIQGLREAEPQARKRKLQKETERNIIEGERSLVPQPRPIASVPSLLWSVRAIVCSELNHRHPDTVSMATPPSSNSALS